MYQLNITEPISDSVSGTSAQHWTLDWSIVGVLILTINVYRATRFLSVHWLTYLRLRTRRRLLAFENKLADHVMQRFVDRWEKLNVEKLSRVLSLSASLFTIYAASGASVAIWGVYITVLAASHYAIPGICLITAVSILEELFALSTTVSTDFYNTAFVFYTGPPLIPLPGQRPPRQQT